LHGGQALAAEFSKQFESNGVVGKDSSLLNPASQSCQRVKTIRIPRRCKVANSKKVQFRSKALSDFLMQYSRISNTSYDTIDEAFTEPHIRREKYSGLYLSRKICKLRSGEMPPFLQELCMNDS
jgi:hypothetical protein